MLVLRSLSYHQTAASEQVNRCDGIMEALFRVSIILELKHLDCSRMGTFAITIYSCHKSKHNHRPKTKAYDSR